MTRGRRPLPPELRRRRRVRVYLTASEDQKVKAKAQEAGLRVAAYIRTQSLNCELPKTAITRETVAELRDLGLVINGMARRVNQGENVGEEELRVALRQVLDILPRCDPRLRRPRAR